MNRVTGQVTLRVTRVSLGKVRSQQQRQMRVQVKILIVSMVMASNRQPSGQSYRQQQGCGGDVSKGGGASTTSGGAGEAANGKGGAAALGAAARLARVHEVTEREAEEGRFSIADVVLPLPGSQVGVWLDACGVGGLGS